MGRWRGTLLTTSSDSSSGGMWVIVPHVRVSMTVLCISRDSPKSATFAVKPCGVSCNNPITHQHPCLATPLLLGVLQLFQYKANSRRAGRTVMLRCRAAHTLLAQPKKHLAQA